VLSEVLSEVLENEKNEKKVRKSLLRRTLLGSQPSAVIGNAQLASGCLYSRIA
jgi:hypothetical protein